MSTTLDDAKQALLGLAADLGRGTLHSLYPNDFEYYMMTFELINSKGLRENMLLLPILPDDIRYSINTLSSVRKTSSGVVSMFNPTFVSFPITLQGTFGKKLKFLLGDSEFLSLAFNLRSSLGKQTGSDTSSTWNTQIKTGYGVTKLFEGILQKSQTLDDDGKPYKLIFTDSCFNKDLVVEINNYTFEQNSRSNNGYWNYSVQMTAIAPALAIRKTSPSSLNKLVAIDETNKFVQGFIDNNKAGFLNRL